ncbi:MAG: dethiobiotin synthase [Pseudomonadota bacterium]
MSGYFITGTDTGVGKTVVTLAVMEKLKQQGLTVAGFKPVASGCSRGVDGLRNSDAVQIMQAGSCELPYSLVNPYAFEPPIAPHLAAARSGEPIRIERIASIYRQLEQRAERVVMEGAGGWAVPLGDDAMLPDVACRLGLTVILVVGLRLGCINHALLTAAAIRMSGLEFGGWIANQQQPELDAMDDIVDAMQQRIDAPLVGVVPWRENPKPGEIAAYLEGFPEHDG